MRGVNVVEARMMILKSELTNAQLRAKVHKLSLQKKCLGMEELNDLEDFICNWEYYWDDEDIEKSDIKFDIDRMTRFQLLVMLDAADDEDIFKEDHIMSELMEFMCEGDVEDLVKQIKNNRGITPPGKRNSMEKKFSWLYHLKEDYIKETKVFKDELSEALDDWRDDGDEDDDERPTAHIKPMKAEVSSTYSEEALNMVGHDSKEIISKLKKFIKLKDKGEIKKQTFLLMGAPGTGKSEWAVYVAKELGLNVIRVTAADILNCWIGESEKFIKDVFVRAKEENAVLIIDEIESILTSRNGSEHSWEKSHMSEFLTSLERHEGIAFFTTNVPEGIDRALIRRFSYKIKFNEMEVEHLFLLFEGTFFPITRQKLTQLDKAKLLKMSDVSVGDFLPVKERLIFSEKVTNSMVLNELKSEIESKDLLTENYL